MKNANEIKAIIEKKTISEEALNKEAQDIANTLLECYAEAIERRIIENDDHKCRFFLDGDVYRREEEAFMMSFTDADIHDVHLKANDDIVRNALKEKIESYGYKVTIACAASTFFIVHI